MDRHEIQQSQSFQTVTRPYLTWHLLKRASQYLCADTHIPWKLERGGRLAPNPGAVCGPLNGDVRAQYALLIWYNDHWRVKHYAVPYDPERIRAAFRESGLLEEGGVLANAFLQ